MSKGKIIVLGLVTTKLGDLESKDSIKRRIDEAAQSCPIEQLALSPRCGSLHRAWQRCQLRATGREDAAGDGRGERGLGHELAPEVPHARVVPDSARNRRRARSSASPDKAINAGIPVDPPPDEAEGPGLGFAGPVAARTVMF